MGEVDAERFLLETHAKTRRCEVLSPGELERLQPFAERASRRVVGGLPIGDLEELALALWATYSTTERAATNGPKQLPRFGTRDAAVRYLAAELRALRSYIKHDPDMGSGELPERTEMHHAALGRVLEGP